MPDINKGPCMACAERKPACHDQCEKYKEWKEERDNLKKWLRGHHSTLISEQGIRAWWRSLRYVNHKYYKRR